MAKPSRALQWLNEDGLNLITYLKQTGITEAEIAKKMGIGYRTLCEWKVKYPQINASLKKGEDFAKADAFAGLKSLFKVQVLKETITQIWYDNDGNEHKTVTVKEKEIPPEKTAIIFYLKAKCGWRDNYQISDTTAIAKLDELLKMTQESAENEIFTEAEDILSEGEA